MQRTADRLQAEGIVAYADNPAHRRARLVMLTPQGRSALDWITQRQIVWANGLGARLGAADLHRALLIIRAFRQALEQADQKPRNRSARRRSPGDRIAITGAEEGRTVLMVDQNVIAGTKVADYIYVLELGRNRIECDKGEFDATYLATIAEWLIRGVAPLRVGEKDAHAFVRCFCRTAFTRCAAAGRSSISTGSWRWGTRRRSSRRRKHPYTCAGTSHWHPGPL